MRNHQSNKGRQKMVIAGAIVIVFLVVAYIDWRCGE
jgi:hypothetical protein